MNKVIMVIWILASIVLVFSGIGLLLFVPKDRYIESKENTRSSWCEIGLTIAQSFKKS